MGLQLQLLSSYSVECFELRHGKYGNPVGELLTRSKQGSQLYYEVRCPVCLRLGRMVQPQRLFGMMWNHCDLWYFFTFSSGWFDFTDIPMIGVVTIGKKQRSWWRWASLQDARHGPSQQYQILKEDPAQQLYSNLSGMHRILPQFHFLGNFPGGNFPMRPSFYHLSIPG